MVGVIVTWLLSNAIKLASGPILDKALEAFNKTQDTKVKLSEVDSDTIKEAMKQWVESQKVEAGKWQFPWFWIMAGLLLGPVIIHFWAVSLYDIFWWQYGLWPQAQVLPTGDVVGWKIAAFPGILEDWASTAFHWVFAPALGVGAIVKLLKK